MLNTKIVRRGRMNIFVRDLAGLEQVYDNIKLPSCENLRKKAPGIL